MPLRPILKCLALLFIFSSTLNSSFALTTLAQAETQSAVNFVDAGRVGKQVRDSVREAPKPALKEDLGPPPEPVTKEAKIHFKLTKVIFIGNTVYSQKELGKIFASSLDREISLQDLQKMVRDITIKYRTAGYILTRAILPPQVIKNGIVQVQTIEGFISKVVIKGDFKKVGSLLSVYGKSIMRARPLQVHVLERYALLANDLPGVSVKMVINPSKTIPGGADLTFVTTQQIGSAYVAYDNYGTRYIGPNEFSVGGSLYSLFVPGDNNTLRFAVTTRPHELQYAEISHARPLGTQGVRLLVGTNYAETKPQFVLAPSEILGRNHLAYADISYPWIRSRDHNINFHAGLNYQNVMSTLAGLPFYNDLIRSLDVGVALDKMDSWHGINSATGDFIHGFNILGAKPHVNQSRIDGHSQYTRLTAAVSRLQGIEPQISLFGALKGQYSYQALLATEQFGVGGPDFGRGYDPSEIVGDHGISGKLELRLDTAPEYALLHNVQYYAFYDAGLIWNIDNVNLPGKQSVTSAGLGARFNFIPQVTGNFFIAKPITKKVAVLQTLGQNTNHIRAFFQVIASIP